MDSSRLVASIDIALDKLRYWKNQTNSFDDYTEFGIIMHRLCGVKTFCFCSMTLANNVELRAEGKNDNAVTSLRSRKKKMKQKKRELRQSVGSLLVRVEDILPRILNIHSCYVPYDLENEIRCCDGEMDTWYTSLSVFLKKYSTSPGANQIRAILDSALEILKDYPSSRIGYDFQWKQWIEALEKNITGMRNIICFGNFLCPDYQEFRCLLTQIEPLAISAAHLTLRLFFHKGPKHPPDDLTCSMHSGSLLKFNHADNPLLHEKYTLGLNVYYPFIMKMVHCIDCLSSTLLEMVQLGTKVSLKEVQLYERLVLLRILLKRQPDRFNGDKIQNLITAVVFDAVVRIFSSYQKDSATDHWLQCFLENSEMIWAEVLEEKVIETSTSNFPKTDVLGFLNFLIEDYLMDVNSSNIDSNTLSCVPKIREHLVFLKSFMGKLAELRNQQENLYQDVWNLGVQIVYKIEFLIDQLVLGDVLDSFSMSLESITEGIMILEADSLNIFNDEGRQEIFEAQNITWQSADKVPSIISSPVADDVVGFTDETTSIINRLMGGFNKLQVVAVVGMPGLGKTTLATKVYRDSSITHHFHVKAWCSISQVCDRRKIILELLNQIKPGENNLLMNEDDLSQILWRSLRKRKYLIFMDDIWDIEAFNLIRGSLPDDSNQSRILITSRHEDAVPRAILDDKPLFLQPLTVDASLELLQKKLFQARKDWPLALHAFGMEVVEYCNGLPLIIVITAGLLKTTDQEGWKDTLRNLRSSIVPDVADQCESTIELSYRHLPDHLKPCLLWFGAFPEDHEISVKELIWLWIADGLVQKSGAKSLEVVALDYLKILIGRSLVMGVKERATGGVKVCRIHDLLHVFCLRKAKEDYFLLLLKARGDGEQGHLSSDEFEISSFNEPKQPSDEPDNPRRLCIYAEPRHLENGKFFFSGLRSLLFLAPIYLDREPDLSFILRMFKLLRVLDVEQVYLKELPSEVGLLFQLRYLAIRVYGNISPDIGKLFKLETLILTGVGGVFCLPALWSLRKLRHLYSKGCTIELPIENSERSCNLLELETLSTLCVRDLSVMEKQLRKFPNIRQIKCEFKYGSVTDDGKVVDFSFLSQLESLSLSNYNFSAEFYELNFPENIKKLTLWGTNYPWNKIASIAKLPHLEVLKLLRGSFFGDAWHVEEGEFPGLKFLKLQYGNLVNWTAASDDLFIDLERLVLDYCSILKEVPECLENAATLEMIHVFGCSHQVVRLVKKVVESQKEMGNSVLKFHESRTWYEC